MGGWNRGLTKSTDKRVARNGVKAGAGVRKFLTSLTPEGKAKFFADKKPKNTSRMGGVRKGAGRGKKGWYKGYWCDSSWELAWVIYQTDHGCKFTRNTRGFEYTFESRVRKFYPDFLFEDQTYVEIKGWLDRQNQTKIEQFHGKLLVLGEKEIQPFIDYAVTSYGKAYITLMGASSPVYLCADCGKQISCKRWKRCLSCAGKVSQPTKIKWPDISVLQELLDRTSYVAVGKILGVSDNAVRKHLKMYGGTGRI